MKDSEDSDALNGCIAGILFSSILWVIILAIVALTYNIAKGYL